MSPERSAAERLTQRAMQLFADAEGQRSYDEYIRWREIKALLDAAGDAAANNDGKLPQLDAEKALDRLGFEVGDREEALLLLQGYCATHMPAITLPARLDAAHSRPQPPSPPEKPPTSQRGEAKTTAKGYVPPPAQPPQPVRPRPVQPSGGYCKRCGEPAVPGTEYCSKHTPGGNKAFLVAVAIVAVLLGFGAFAMVSGVGADILSAIGIVDAKAETVESGSWAYCDEETSIHPVDAKGRGMDWNQARLYACDLNGEATDTVSAVQANGAKSLSVEDFGATGSGNYRLEIEGSGGETYLLLIHYKSSSLDVSANVVNVIGRG